MVRLSEAKRRWRGSRSASKSASTEELKRRHISTTAASLRRRLRIAKHTDTEHDHVHIAASRIDVQGKVVSDFQSKMRAEAVMREVERERAAAVEQQRTLEEPPAGCSMAQSDRSQELGERGEQERGRTAELTQSPEVETTKEVVQEIEREAERVITWELSL